MMGAIPGEPPRPLRAWQASALPQVLAALREGTAGVVQACTGAGKSILLAEVAACRPPSIDEAVIVTTPTQQLVEQLYDTLTARMGGGWVGRYYTARKEADRPVIVTCHPSALDLVAELRRQGRRVTTWIADECHKTESPEMHAVAAELGDVARVGCTATPFRSEERERLRLWQKVIVKYTPGDALRDGVIVPWRVVPWTGKPLVKIDEAVIEMIVRDAPAGPGVVNAITIDSAIEFAERLSAAGVPAAAIHSRLSPRERGRLLADLEAGRLRCLVYPSMLSEGFDFPALRWLALRRAVKARVRFIQEMGRVLRASPGKVEAVILDPLALIEEHSLAYDPALGWKEYSPAEPEEEEADPEEVERKARELYAKPLAVVSSWARQLAVAAIAAGVAKPPKSKGEDAAWRAAPASASQLDAIQRLLWAKRFLPLPHATALGVMYRSRAVESAGVASDILGLLSGLADRQREWTPPATIAPPAGKMVASAGREAKTGEWYAAGVARGGRVAIAVVHGSQTVLARVKETNGGNTLAADVAAAKAAARLAVAAGETNPLIRVGDESTRRMLVGQGRAVNPAVVAACEAPAPRFRVDLTGSKNPAASVAWRELVKAEKKAAKAGAA